MSCQSQCVLLPRIRLKTEKSTNGTIDIDERDETLKGQIDLPRDQNRKGAA